MPAPTTKRGTIIKERKRNKNGKWRKKRNDYGKKRAMQEPLPISEEKPERQNIISEEMEPKEK